MDAIDYRDSGELSDIRVVVDDKEFNLHRFPLFVRSNYFKNTAAKMALSEQKDKLTIRLENFPGGAKTFALVADYCYNKEIHVDSVNIIDVKCAAEFLEMNGKGGLCMFVDNILFDILYIAKTKRNFKLILQLLEEAIRQKELVERCKLNLRLLDGFIDYISLSMKLNSAYNIRQNDLLSKDELKIIYNLPLSWFIYLIKSKVHTSSYSGLLSTLVEIYVDYNTNLNPNFNSQLLQPLMQPLQIDVQTSSDKVKTSSPAISPITLIQSSSSNNLNSNSNDDLQATSSQFMDSPAVRSKNFSDHEKIEIIREVAVAFNEAYYENQLSLTWLLTYLNILNSFNADAELKSIFLKWIWSSFNNLRHSSQELNSLPADVMVLLVEDIASREDPTGINSERLVSLTDHYLSELEKNKKLTPEIFIHLAQSIPKDKRHSFDNLMTVLLEMLKKDCFSISQQKQQDLLDLIDFHKLNESTLELCKNSESIPQKYVTEAALALCAKLRKELDDQKTLVKSLEVKAYPTLSRTATKTTQQLLADLNLYKPAKSSYTSPSTIAATPLLTTTTTKSYKPATVYSSPLRSASSSNLYKKPSTPVLTARKPVVQTASIPRRTASSERLRPQQVVVLSSDDDDINSLDDENSNSLCNYHRSRFYDELLQSRDYYYTPTTTSYYRPTYSVYYDSFRY